MKTAKQKAIETVSRLPEDASWQDMIYRLEVRRQIEEGIKAAEERRVVSHDEVKKLFARK